MTTWYAVGTHFIIIRTAIFSNVCFISNVCILEGSRDYCPED